MGHPGELAVGDQVAASCAVPAVPLQTSAPPFNPFPTPPWQTFLLWLCTFKLTIATSAVFLTLSLLFFFLAGGVSGSYTLACCMHCCLLLRLYARVALAWVLSPRATSTRWHASGPQRVCRPGRALLLLASAPRLARLPNRIGHPLVSTFTSPHCPVRARVLQVGTSQSARNFTKFAGAWGFLVAAIAFYDGQ